MKRYDVVQGSPEWFQLRLGIPTASEFDKIITTMGAASKSADMYANQLIAEEIAGEPVETFEGNSWTQRGKELEPEAAKFYEQLRDCTCEVIGFCTDDARTMGASFDRFVGDDGLLEIKVPAPKTHVSYLLNENVSREYYPQIQGQLLISGRKWCDIISYHPKMPPSIIRVDRDQAYLMDMVKHMNNFKKTLAAKRSILIDRGILKVKP